VLLTLPRTCESGSSTSEKAQNAHFAFIGFLRSSSRFSPTRFYLSFTKGLRPFNAEAQRRVYSFGGPGSTVLFHSFRSS
jgi:hypothetical protein